MRAVGVEVKFYKTTAAPVVLYGSEAQSARQLTDGIGNHDFRDESVRTMSIKNKR